MRDFTSKYIVPDMNMTRKLILESIVDEREAGRMYDDLARMATRKHDKWQLTSIANDEKKHERMFKDIYRMLFKNNPRIEEKYYKPPGEYLKGLELAMMDEIKAVEMYRVIMRGLPYEREYQDMMYEIITDEQKHADKLGHIIMEEEMN